MDGKVLLSLSEIVRKKSRQTSTQKLDSKMNDRPENSGSTSQFKGEGLTFSSEDIKFWEGTYQDLIG